MGRWAKVVGWRKHRSRMFCKTQKAETEMGEMADQEAIPLTSRTSQAPPASIHPPAYLRAFWGSYTKTIKKLPKHPEE